MTRPSIDKLGKSIADHLSEDVPSSIHERLAIARAKALDVARSKMVEHELVEVPAQGMGSSSRSTLGHWGAGLMMGFILFGVMVYSVVEQEKEQATPSVLPEMMENADKQPVEDPTDVVDEENTK